MSRLSRKVLPWSFVLLACCIPACDQVPDEEETAGEESSEDAETSTETTSGDTGKDSETGDGDSGDGDSGDSETGESDSGDGDSGDSDSGDSETGGEGDSAGDEEATKLPAVPDDYKGEKNPHTIKDEKVVAAGLKIYETDCEGCHGRSGEGEFPGVPDMTKKSYNKRPDDYLLWRLSEGVGDIMSGFKDKLTREQHWEVITYLRTFANKE